MRQLLILLFLVCSYLAKSEGEIIISSDQNQEQFNLVGNLFYIIDSTENLTFTEVLANQFRTKLTQAPSNTFYFKSNTPAQWYLIDIKNTSKEFKYLTLSINNPLIENLTFYNSIDSSYQHSGICVNYSQREFKYKNFIFPITIPPEANGRFCIRVSAQERGLYLPITLNSGTFFLSKLRNAYLFNGIIYAILFLMLLILLVLWKSEQDKAYLYYGITVFLLGLIKLWRDAVFSQWFFLEQPEINLALERILYSLLPIVILLAINSRFNYVKKKNTIKYFFQGSLALSVLFIISQLFSNSYILLKYGLAIINTSIFTLLIISLKNKEIKKQKNHYPILIAAFTIVSLLFAITLGGYDLKGLGLFDRSIMTIGVFIFFLLSLYILIYKFYLAREEVFLLNRDLEIKVEERTAQINSQKEELRQQHMEMIQQKESLQNHREELRARKELLQVKNNELEKLSLVASKTNNLIYIFDPDGDLDWYNSSFANIIGKSHDEYINESNKLNIMEISSNKNIRHIVNSCLKEKTVVSYESSKEVNNELKWYHTTLTPILDSRDNIKHLIAIDTDISQLKEYEEAIERQRRDAESQKNLALKRKEELEVRQLEITDSIRYAKRIQTAIMPSVKQIFRDFPDNFVLFLPKDIVSGDFYWYHRVKEKYFIAAVDCTGHGVPGAFMSIIGNYLLNSIIIHNGVEKPSEILKQLNRKIKIALKSDSRDQASDGMDIAISVIDKKESTLQFASALRPLYAFQNGSFLEIKGDKAPITSNITGSMLSNYTNHEIKMEEGDAFYMFSDGIIDQFGGKRGKKFLTKRFKQLLFEINPLSMREQKEIIRKAFDEWKGTYEQVDDILVMGIRHTKETNFRRMM